ncbi:MAG: YncE family protein [Anaerolineae bacterium]|nr:YncE family protein [Anaerolineae bacterium]
MIKRYNVLLSACGFALLGLLLLSLSVRAEQLGPPYVTTVQKISSSTNHPSKAAVNTRQGYAYIIDASTVYIFQGTEVSTTLSLNLLKDIVVDPRGYVYLSRRTASPMIVLSQTTVLTTLTGLQAVVEEMAVMSTTGIMYATLPYENQVTIIKAGHILTSVTVGTTPRTIAMGDTAKERVYVANQDDATISVIEGQTVITTYAVPYSPTNLLFAPDTSLLYVAHAYDDQVSILYEGNPSAMGTISDTLPITSPKKMAYNPQTGWVYILASDTSDLENRYGWVTVVENTTPLATLSLGHNHEPNAIALNPQSGYIYVTAGRDQDGIAAILSGTQTIEFFPMGQTPSDIAMDPARDLAYVPIYNSRVAIFGRSVAASSPLLNPDSPPTSFVCTGTHQLPVLIQIPTGAIPVDETDVTILCSPLLNVDTAPWYLWAEQAFRIAAYRDNVNLPDFQFATPIQLVISYDESWWAEGVEEDNLKLRARIGGLAQQVWVDTGIHFIKRHTGQNIITTTITYPADHALVESAEFIFLPIVLRNGG